VAGSWPLSSSHVKFFFMKGIRSSFVVHSALARLAKPNTRPFNTPGEWHEWGGM